MESYYVNIGGREAKDELWVDPRQVVAVKPGSTYTRVFVNGAHTFDTRTPAGEVLASIERDNLQQKLTAAIMAHDIAIKERDEAREGNEELVRELNDVRLQLKAARE